MALSDSMGGMECRHGMAWHGLWWVVVGRDRAGRDRTEPSIPRRAQGDGWHRLYCISGVRAGELVKLSAAKRVGESESRSDGATV